MKALKNKKLIPVLLVVAVGVWGLIIYRVAVYSGGGRVMTKMAEKRHAITNEESDTLFLNYRDPFLGTVPRGVKQPSPRVRTGFSSRVSICRENTKGETGFLVDEVGRQYAAGIRERKKR